MATLPVNELKEVIDLKEELGSGAYGVVKLVSVHGTICAAKDVHKILLQHVSKRESTAVKEKFMQECVHCSKLLHPNIVQFLGTYYPSEDAELPWLIMEKLDCSLTDYVEKHKHAEIYFPVKVSIFNDVLLGLQYLHAQKIIHRDLSSNNILLTKFLVAKITDFGMAKLVDPSKIISLSKQPGTPVFMPPEALHDHSKYNSSIDVFSFGCVMIHLMVQEFPYPESTMRLDKNIGKYVTFTQAECREKYLAKIHKPPPLRELILQSIEDMPDKRPSINELLKYFETFLKQQISQGICLDKDQTISKLQAELREKEEQIVKLTVDISNQDVVIKSNETCNKDLMDKQKQFEDNLTKVKESSSKASMDADGLHETAQRLTNEVAILRKQNLELTKQNESLIKRCDSYRSSNESVRAMMQKQSGMSSTVEEISGDDSKCIQHEMDQLQKEYEGYKQTCEQLYASYRALKRHFDVKDKEANELKSQCNELQATVEQLRDELHKTKQELSTLQSDEVPGNELEAKLIEFRTNHALLISEKISEKDAVIAGMVAERQKLEKQHLEENNLKDVEIADLKSQKKQLEKQLKSSLAHRRANVTSTATHIGEGSNKDAELLQGCTSETASPTTSTSALTTATSEGVSVIVKGKEQTTDAGVGSCSAEHVHSGGIVNSPDEESYHDDGLKSQLLDSKKTIDMLKDKLEAEKSAMENVKIQLSESQSEVDKLTQDLIKEKTVTENAKAEVDDLMNQQQQLHRDKRILEKIMNEGYKEREDRITELEEFIHDQVVELDEVEAAMKQTVANKQLLEKDHQKLSEYYKTAKKLVEDYENRFIAQEETISRLNSTIKQNDENATAAITTLQIEREALVQANQKMSREVARLMSVGMDLQNREIEIEKCKVELRKAEEELQTKEFMLNTYEEDFEQERKDQENAHSIKEDEIRKVQIEMEKFEAECEGKIHNVRQSLEAELQSYKEHANYYLKESEKFKREYAKLRAELDKERKDAQGRSDLYKKKTEQFQVQWKRREEAEARVHVLTEQLNAQCELNKQLSSTIDSWQRKQKGIEPQIPSNNMANQQLQGQQRQGSRNLLISNVSTPMDTPSDQYHTSAAMSKPHYDPSVAHTNAGMPYQNQLPSSSTGQQGWQRQQEQQRIHSMQQQQQEEQLHMRGQGRGSSHNQPSYYQPDYQRKTHLPPANIDNHQPRSIQPGYNVAGTNAAPMQRQFQHDEYNYGRNSGPTSLDSSLIKSRSAGGYTGLPSPDQSPIAATRRAEQPTQQPTQYASEAINEEIRYQADRQRRHQEYERFDSTLQLDPYLICPKCQLQFREGQLPEYRHHIDNCQQ